jgi:hypothetical protein
MFIIVFHLQKAIYICISFNSFVIFLVSLLLYVQVANFVFSVLWIGAYILFLRVREICDLVYIIFIVNTGLK